MSEGRGRGGRGEQEEEEERKEDEKNIRARKDGPNILPKTGMKQPKLTLIACKYGSVSASDKGPGWIETQQNFVTN